MCGFERSITSAVTKHMPWAEVYFSKLVCYLKTCPYLHGTTEIYFYLLNRHWSIREFLGNRKMKSYLLAKVIRCYWHWTHALRKHLGDQHLLTLYSSSGMFHTLVKLLHALLFVPVEHVSSYSCFVWYLYLMKRCSKGRGWMKD